MSIILDEYKHVENILQNGIQTNNSKFEVQLLATYLRENGANEKEMENKLHEFCKHNYNDYNKVKQYKFIDSVIQRSKKLKLKRAYPVNITKKEIDVILREENYKYQKLMFVYLVLAKYYMSNNHTEKYYVGCKDNDIFNFCDMYMRKSDKMDSMHHLTKKGYITPTLSMSSIVNYVNEDSEIIMTFIPDNDMVYHFEKYVGGIFINCDMCGRLVKKTNNRIKYCKECAKIVKNG